MPAEKLTELPWSMSATLTGSPNTPEPHPLDVTFRTHPAAPWRPLFRKCCPCMAVNFDGKIDDGIPRWTRLEFICGCGSHPSVMVCDGKVIGTSA